MEVQYFINAIIIFLSFFIGALIAWIAKEELIDGRKYFNVIKKVIFFVSLALTVYYNQTLAYILISILFLVTYLIIKKKYLDITTQVMFGIIFALTYEIGIIVQILILFNCIIQGTTSSEKIILSDEKSKFSKVSLNILKKYIWFLVTVIILGLI